jgi:hypothetical protein
MEIVGGYKNKWFATSDPSGFGQVKAIFSKWCPPGKNKAGGPGPPDSPPGPCWQDDYGEARPYTYGTYRTSKFTNRKCPWAKGRHYAPETSNLVIDSTHNSHWCYDANVERTGSGILEYLNEVINSEEEDLQIFHIIVNSTDHDGGGGSISLDLAFPLNSCNPHFDRFEDGTLFVREYRKGERRGTGKFLNREPDVCNNCWESDNLSMRVGDEPNSSLRADSNGRRGLSKPISKDDITEAEKNNEDWIIYDFSVTWATGAPLRIAFQTKTLKDVIKYPWNSSPIFTNSFDWGRRKG